MPQTKIQEKFYPLTVSIAEVLRQAKLTATEWRIWSYLAQLDPFGDRYTDFDYLSVMSACDCSKSSFYRAIAKFQKFNIFDFQCQRWSMRNLVGVSTFGDRQPPPEPEPAQCQDWENSVKTGKTVSELGNESQNCEKKSPSCPENQQSSPPQTLQKDHILQTREEEENNFQEKEVNQERKLIKLNHEVAQSESKQKNPKEIHKDTTKSIKKKNVPARVVREKTKIPNDLRDRLKKLGIVLDDKILTAIANHDISQAYGACLHVENTWDTIKNPRSVFLFQLPKQKIEPLGTRLPEIGSKMREINQAIEDEMTSDEYKSKSQEMFAKLREKLGGNKS